MNKPALTAHFTIQLVGLLGCIPLAIFDFKEAVGVFGLVSILSLLVMVPIMIMEGI